MSNDASPSPAARATTIVLLALALLALAACASPLSALVPGGGSAIREEDAGGLAQQHWLEKYGESRDATEVIRPRYATSIPWPREAQRVSTVMIRASGNSSRRSSAAMAAL